MPRGSDLAALEWLERAAAGGDETARADAHGGEQQTPDLFVHAKMAARYPAGAISSTLAQGSHFVDPRLPWNAGTSQTHC